MACTDNPSTNEIFQREIEEELRANEHRINESPSNLQDGLPHSQLLRRQGRIADQLQGPPPQRHLSIWVAPIPECVRTSSDLESSYTFFWNGLLNVLWRIVDNVLLLRMGSAYLIRFHELAVVAEGGSDLKSIDDWRKDQQAEWDRLSLTVRS